MVLLCSLVAVATNECLQHSYCMCGFNHEWTIASPV